MATCCPHRAAASAALASTFRPLLIATASAPSFAQATRPRYPGGETRTPDACLLGPARFRDSGRRLLAEMREWGRPDGEKAPFVCPAPGGEGPITREAVEKFCRRTLKLTGTHSPHSWRSVLKTSAENAERSTDAVEAQLGHVIGGKVAASHEAETGCANRTRRRPGAHPRARRGVSCAR